MMVVSTLSVLLSFSPAARRLRRARPTALEVAPVGLEIVRPRNNFRGRIYSHHVIDRKHAAVKDRSNHIVIHNHANGTSTVRQLALLRNRAVPPGQQDYSSLCLGRKIARVAPLADRRRKRSPQVLRLVAAPRGVERLRLPADGPGTGASAEALDEGLELDVVVLAELLDLLVDVVDGLVVTVGAECTGASALLGEGKRLESPGLAEEVFGIDLAGEGLGGDERTAVSVTDGRDGEP